MAIPRTPIIKVLCQESSFEEVLSLSILIAALIGM